MNDKIAICTLAFGWKYSWRMYRLKETVENIYGPDYPIFMHDHTLPPGARQFNESLYGFKPHCILEARNAGYNRIAWIDCTAVLQDKLEYYDQFTDEYGVLAVQDDNKLKPFLWEKAFRYIGKSKEKPKDVEWLADKHLIGGSFYYFDFTKPLCNVIFDKWLKAEKDGMFGNMVDQCAERLQGHRSDETMLALALYTSGSKPFSGATRYNWEKGGIIQKMHFK